MILAIISILVIGYIASKGCRHKWRKDYEIRYVDTPGGTPTKIHVIYHCTKCGKFKRFKL